jgi:hypothetical protein
MSDFEEIVAANPLAQRALRRDHRPELQAGQHRLDGDAFEQFPDAPVIRGRQRSGLLSSRAKPSGPVASKCPLVAFSVPDYYLEVFSFQY